jgi:hypothetical protein
VWSQKINEGLTTQPGKLAFAGEDLYQTWTGQPSAVSSADEALKAVGVVALV